MKNQYFRVVQVNSDNTHKMLTCVHIKQDIDIWHEICIKYLDTKEYAKMAHEDPYGSIYELDLKEYIKNDFPDAYNIIDSSLRMTGEANIESPNIKIWLASSEDYRKVDENFDNELSFLEYMNSEISEIDKNSIITVQILKDAGFEENTLSVVKDLYKNEYDIDGYSLYSIWTKDKNPIKIDIDNGLTNSNRKWHVHIDNADCCSIGSAEIDNVYQFNLLMKVFDSKFRL